MRTKLRRLFEKVYSFSPVVLMMVVCMSGFAYAADHVATVAVVSDSTGQRIQVDGEDFMVNGMNWDYFPIGTNYSYSLWNQSDDIITAALDREMALLRGMGVNVIRQYSGIPPRWVKHIYEKYGIFTILNHSFARYGFNINGAWVPNVDYSDPDLRKGVMDEVTALVAEFQDVPGVLMWLLGNENNYGLFWKGAETEDIPEGETIESVRAHHMYSLFNEAINTIHLIDPKRPVAIANGDLLFVDIIAEEIENLDVFGSNVYRGISFRDFFQVVDEKLGVPVLFTEFGSDAFNAKDMAEDQEMQAKYLIGNWKEIYEQSSGKGRVGNAIGGLTFQFSDGWWKYGQTSNLNIHDNNASWANGGYPDDLVEGENNMNEEWFGICAKGPTDSRGLYQLYPRAAYYALQRVHALNPYDPSVDREYIKRHFAVISPVTAALQARGDKAALNSESGQKIRVSGLRVEFETFNTGGENISTPEDQVAGSTAKPGFQGFDHMQSYYITVEANPAPNVTGSVSVNYLGHVAENLIDEIYFENRGLVSTVLTQDGPLKLAGLQRVKVYNAQITWDDKLFKLEGFYRTGHYHWGYEGDFFGLYPEANYGYNIDIYNGEAPLGVEITGKRFLDGLKLAYGPELWWGANPAYLVKYQQSMGPFGITGVYHEDIDEQGAAVSSFAVPLPPTKKTTLHLETTLGGLGLELGGIWSGATKIDETFQIVEGSSGSYEVFQDTVRESDTYGGKFKVTYSSGRLNWYLQGASMGIVAAGGPTATQTFAGWHLKDTGSGNQVNIISGLTLQLGNWQIAPNILWQKPLVDPIPSDVPAPGRPRNVLADPFAVRANREMTAYEMLLTYDPTPATWMYEWNNDLVEDAPFAASIDFVLRQHATTQDASIGILADGRTTFAFPGAPPAKDIWEVNGRFVSKLSPDLGIIVNMYAGQGEPNGDDPRVVERSGADLRLVMGSMKLMTQIKMNDWGPYDYHRDYNLTYPLQLIADISTTVGKASWWDLPGTRLGINYTYRTLDQYSPRYCPTETMNDLGIMTCDPEATGFDDGKEWQIQTYLHLNIGR
ncbi:MAG: glycoside hydrolase family 2 TIM barrel-domain containing protein [Candidatus Marinimicrobia bacterium]|nr:glycoside hydrolase family 2 TIM barrel-domain containing protein [Candidatus Neomarinimicrobiota bacterium]